MSKHAPSPEKMFRAAYLTSGRSNPAGAELQLGACTLVDMPQRTCDAPAPDCSGSSANDLS